MAVETCLIYEFGASECASTEREAQPATIFHPAPSMPPHSLSELFAIETYELTSGSGPNTWCVSQRTLTALTRPMMAELVCSEEMARKVLTRLEPL